MKKILTKILAISVILIVIMNSNIILAATKPDADTSALEKEQKENDQKKEQAEGQLKQVQAQKSETVKQVEEISSKIDSYESQIDELDTKIEDYNAKISSAEKEINEKQESYNQNEKLLEERLVTAYESGNTSYLDVILSSDNLTDLISNYYLVSELATYDGELLEKIQTEKEEIQKTKASLEENKKSVTTAKAEKQKVATQLQQTKTEKSNYVSKLSEDEKQIEAKIEEIKKANQTLDAQIKQKQAAVAAWKKKQEEEKAAAEAAAKKQAQNNSSSKNNNSSNSGASSNSTASTKTGSSGFIRPVNSYVTTGLYYSSGRYHGGVDFGAGGVNGMPVYAVADGYVVSVARLTTSYGNHILIAHANGLYTLYAHGQAGSICVSEGQVVKQGQQIMRVGSTGNSTGPHLHFEVRTSPGTYSNRVNPLAYLP